MIQGLSARAKSSEVGGRTIVLKLKSANFRLKTRSASLEEPTQLADRIFRIARSALQREADGTAYRLLGVGITNLSPAHECDRGDLLDPEGGKRAAAERAIDKVRSRFGGGAVGKGRSLKPSPARRIPGDRSHGVSSFPRS